jgi:protoporphyrinogen oxidase
MACDTAVIGGGMAGMAAALTLAEHGQAVTLVEAADHLGGLASSFERDGRLMPLGYHHILSSDSHLLAFLARFGLLKDVHWKRLEMGFSVEGQIHGMANLSDFAKFPLPWRVKARMAARVATAWVPMSEDEPASAWLTRVAGKQAVESFFDPLTHIKFGLPTSGLSAAWLRERLAAGEAGCRYGYMPNADWVSVVVQTLHERLQAAGVRILMRTAAGTLELNERRDRVHRIALTNGELLKPRSVVAALAPPVLCRLTPDAPDPHLSSIDYSGVVSTVIATHQHVPLDRYWTNFIRPTWSFGGIFRLDLLNESLGHPGVKLLNFCTHVRQGKGSFLHLNAADIEERYISDFETRFGIRMEPEWIHTSRIPMYSPVFVNGYTNPPVQHRLLSNLFLAGNHRTFPVLATTGSAMGSGVEAAAAVLSSPGSNLTEVKDTEAA